MSESYTVYLRNLLKEKHKHNQGLVSDVVPFLSKRSGKIRGRFNKVLGNYIREICNLELDSASINKQELKYTEEENDFSRHIAENVETKNDDDKADFIRFLNQYLFDQEDIKLIHPFLFNYIKVNNKEKNEFNKYANFMRDVLITEKDILKSIFNNKETEDILTELVISELDILKKSDSNKREYAALLEPLAKLYEEDVVYLSKHRDYFLSSFPLITHYYVFMYIVQLIVKFQRFSEASYEKLEPLYFTLDWESLSRRRKAADDLSSYRYVKSKQENLFPHIHTLSHLSHLAADLLLTEDSNINTNKDLQEINLLTYSNIRILIAEGKLDGEKFYQSLKEWMVDYSSIFNIDFHQSATTGLNEAFKELFGLLKRGTSSRVAERFGGNLEDLGANQFIKNRGSLGQVLNIKHDFLLLLTAVSVKDVRIPLNELFSEFEKRGIALDRYSKQEVIKLLDKLNILDKKSDSGDAQYVKPIL